VAEALDDEAAEAPVDAPLGTLAADVDADVAGAEVADDALDELHPATRSTAEAATDSPSKRMISTFGRRGQESLDPNVTELCTRPRCPQARHRHRRSHLVIRHRVDRRRPTRRAVRPAAP